VHSVYQWVVFTHVLAVFGFLIAHGASAAVIFRLRRERDVSTIRVLLDLSRRANGVANACLLLLIVAGVAAGFIGGWWGRYWIWAALGALILLTVAMFAVGSGPLTRVRQLVDREEAARMNRRATQAQQSVAGVPVEEEVAKLLAATRPVLVTLIGTGGLAIILWLMMFKPF
jgi:amino acid transporter